MRFILSIFSIFITSISYGRNLTAVEKDSLKSIICKMEETDQAIRKSPVKDTISVAAFNAIDQQNFKTLEKIINDFGFPDSKLLGKMKCHVYGIMIHWAKEYPEWFNSKKMVNIFKREIDNGNMPLFAIDNAQFFYISYLKADTDMTYWKLINEARLTYGLTSYSKAQYQKKEWIEPLKGNERQNTPERLSNQ